MKNKTILVTGSNGQLGTSIKKEAKNYSNFNFVFTDIDEFNICNKIAIDEYLEQNKIDYIINCAAYTAVDKAEEDQENAIKVNAIGSTNIAQSCKKHNIKLIHVSTDYVFDGKGFRPYKESDGVNPQSVYGDSKLKGEINVKGNCTDFAIVRTSWLYSYHGHNFFKTMLKLGAERDELNVVFDQIGTPTFSDDLALVLVNMIEYAEKIKFISGIFHYSNEGVCSWYDFANEIFDQSGISCKVNPIESKDYPTPAKRPFYSVLNKTKIKNTFNIEIPHWADSLSKCLDTVTNN